ncbi:MAG: hypothetical protein HYX27_02755 [Acidobacteria bacterium]|nr:hypothetical protein [Acidobacteriota bacterium]
MTAHLDRWRQMSPEEQAKTEEERSWPLADWLYWMDPSRRRWWWWDAQELPDLDHIVLAVEVNDWPFPWGALRWLFRAAGASSVVAEEESQ